MPTYKQIIIDHNGPAFGEKFKADSLEDAIQYIKNIIPNESAYASAREVHIFKNSGGKPLVILKRALDFQ